MPATGFRVPGKNPLSPGGSDRIGSPISFADINARCILFPTHSGLTYPWRFTPTIIRQDFGLAKKEPSPCQFRESGTIGNVRRCNLRHGRSGRVWFVCCEML